MAPSSTTSGDHPSKSGIVTSADGQRSIPSSVRADGTKRKEIRIRPGYRPPEDVEVYRNRTAEAFRTRGKGAGVPGADVGKSDEKTSLSAASAKNAKRREARKRAKDNADADADGKEEAKPDGEEEKVEGPETMKDGGPDVPAEPRSQQDDEQAEKEKKAKKLRKKLREARDLQQKKERGEGLLPEQFQKAIRINELIRELDQLGFGAEEEGKEA